MSITKLLNCKFFFHRSYYILEWLFTLEVSYSERLASSNIYSAKDCYLVRLLLVQRLTALEAELCRVDSSDPTFVSTILDAYTQNPHLKQQSAYHRQVYMIIFLTTGVCWVSFVMPMFHAFCVMCLNIWSVIYHVLVGNPFLIRTWMQDLCGSKRPKANCFYLSVFFLAGWMLLIGVSRGEQWKKL